MTLEEARGAVEALRYENATLRIAIEDVAAPFSDYALSAPLSDILKTLEGRYRQLDEGLAFFNRIVEAADPPSELNAAELVDWLCALIRDARRSTAPTGRI
jgi:hypothetical protein